MSDIQASAPAPQTPAGGSTGASSAPVLFTLLGAAIAVVLSVLIAFLMDRAQSAAAEQHIESLRQELDTWKIETLKTVSMAIYNPAAYAPEMFSDRPLGQVFQNSSTRYLLVTISAQRPGASYTMFGNVASKKTALPNVNSDTRSSIVFVSFIAPAYNSTMAFLVPPGYFYNVTADAQDVKIVRWAESRF